MHAVGPHMSVMANRLPFSTYIGSTSVRDFNVTRTRFSTTCVPLIRPQDPRTQLYERSGARKTIHFLESLCVLCNFTKKYVSGVTQNPVYDKILKNEAFISAALNDSGLERNNIKHWRSHALMVRPNFQFIHFSF